MGALTMDTIIHTTLATKLIVIVGTTADTKLWSACVAVDSLSQECFHSTLSRAYCRYAPTQSVLKFGARSKKIHRKPLVITGDGSLANTFEGLNLYFSRVFGHHAEQMFSDTFYG